MHEKKKLAERGKYHLSWVLSLCWTLISSIVYATRSNHTESSVKKYLISQRSASGCIPDSHSFDRDWWSILV